MASSPEMAPPGFEIPGPPPPGFEIPPSQIECLNPSSPETAPPGFENLKAACLPKVISGDDTWDPPPSQNKSPELAPVEANLIHESPEIASIREDMVEKPTPGTGPVVSETLQSDLPDPLQPLEPPLEPLENENPMGCETVDPLEAHWTPVKTEFPDPAMLVPPSPPPPPPEAPEKTLSGDQLVETNRSETKLENLVGGDIHPDTAILGNKAPFECQTMPLPPEPALQSAVSQSLSQSLGLPPSPPPLPPVSESIVPESSCESLNPLPPPQPALVIPDMVKSVVLKSEHGNFQQYTCKKGQIGDMVPSENETAVPPEVEIVQPLNHIINEPPMKKSQIMHEMQHRLTHAACEPEVEKDPLVSGMPEMGPHGEKDVEALQIDMDMSDDEIADRSPAEMGPPGSDTKDFEILGEAPPGYDMIYPISQTETVTQDTLPVGQMVCGYCQELICYPRGAGHVLCTCCQTINLVLEACQVGNIICGKCSVLLMYPFGAPCVRCSSCYYVTEIGPHNIRSPLSVQQGESYPALELQLSEIS